MKLGTELLKAAKTLSNVLKMLRSWFRPATSGPRLEEDNVYVMAFGQGFGDWNHLSYRKWVNFQHLKCNSVLSRESKNMTDSIDKLMAVLIVDVRSQRAI